MANENDFKKKCMYQINIFLNADCGMCVIEWNKLNPMLESMNENISVCVRGFAFGSSKTIFQHWKEQSFFENSSLLNWVNIEEFKHSNPHLKFKESQIILIDSFHTILFSSSLPISQRNLKKNLKKYGI